VYTPVKPTDTIAESEVELRADLEAELGDIGDKSEVDLKVDLEVELIELKVVELKNC
jgi:hypothetical protein